MTDDLLTYLHFNLWRYSHFFNETWESVCCCVYVINLSSEDSCVWSWGGPGPDPGWSFTSIQSSLVVLNPMIWSWVWSDSRLPILKSQTVSPGGRTCGWFGQSLINNPCSGVRHDLPDAPRVEQMVPMVIGSGEASVDEAGCWTSNPPTLFSEFLMRVHVCVLYPCKPFCNESRVCKVLGRRQHGLREDSLKSVAGHWCLPSAMPWALSVQLSVLCSLALWCWASLRRHSEAALSGGTNTLLHTCTGFPSLQISLVYSCALLWVKRSYRLVLSEK